MKLAASPSGGTRGGDRCLGSMLGGRHPSVTYAQHGRARSAKDNQVFTGGEACLLERLGIQKQDGEVNSPLQCSGALHCRLLFLPRGTVAFSFAW